MRITAAGHICVDLIPALPSGLTIIPGAITALGPLTIRAGGSVFNTGAALSELGADVTAAAAIGDDPLGQILRDQVGHAGMRAHLSLAAGARTPYSIVVEPAGTDRAFLHFPGAAVDFSGDAVEVVGAELLHLGYATILPALVESDGAPLQALFRRAQREGVTTSLDLSVLHPTSPLAELNWAAIISRILPVTDILSPSIDDLASIGLAKGSSDGEIRTAAARLVEGGAAIVVISAGDRGAYLHTGQPARFTRGGPILAGLPPAWHARSQWIPTTTAAKVVSTNGAGDTLTAGLLYGIGEGWGPVDTGRFATGLAAAKIEATNLRDSLERFRATLSLQGQGIA